MKQPFHFSAQAGAGIKQICDAIEGLKALKRKHKEATGLDLDISDDLKGIRSNLKDLIQITEETE